MSHSMQIPCAKLPNGQLMPYVGLGTFKVRELYMLVVLKVLIVRVISLIDGRARGKVNTGNQRSH